MVAGAAVVAVDAVLVGAMVVVTSVVVVIVVVPSVVVLGAAVVVVVGASTDCGFATFAGPNNPVAPTVVWAKLRSLAAGAELATGQLF